MVVIVGIFVHHELRAEFPLVVPLGFREGGQGCALAHSLAIVFAELVSASVSVVHGALVLRRECNTDFPIDPPILNGDISTVL